MGKFFNTCCPHGQRYTLRFNAHPLDPPIQCWWRWYREKVSGWNGTNKWEGFLPRARHLWNRGHGGSATAAQTRFAQKTVASLCWIFFPINFSHRRTAIWHVSWALQLVSHLEGFCKAWFRIEFIRILGQWMHRRLRASGFVAKRLWTWTAGSKACIKRKVFLLVFLARSDISFWELGGWGASRNNGTAFHSGVRKRTPPVHYIPIWCM